MPPGPWTRRREARRRTSHRQTRRVAFRHEHDAQHRAPVGDRAGHGAPRLRLLPRGAQAERPPARPLGGGAARRRAAEQGAGSSARGQHLREVLDELGPTFVKFGQLLSTRPDVVPPDIIVELRGLQDDVRPFPFEQAERVIEEELGQHARAAVPRLRAGAGRGRVDRPGAPRDPAERAPRRGQGAAAGRAAEDRGRPRPALPGGAARAASGSARSTSSTRRQLVDEFARSDPARSSTTGQEARNAQNFHRHFAGDPHVRVPKVYWQYTRPRVLTLEWIDGIQLADLDLVTTTLEERREIAYRITETWMTMIFRHGFFHGDPHPANILLPTRQGRSASSTSARSGSSPTTTCRS